MPEKRNNIEKTHPVPAEPLFRLLDYWRTRKRLCMNSGIFVEHALYVAKIHIWYSFESRPNGRALGAAGSVMTCLVHVRRFPSPTRSIRFGDVSEANGRGTFSHGPRDPKRFGREEKWGLGTRQSYDHLFIIKRMLALEETSLTRENKID